MPTRYRVSVDEQNRLILDRRFSDKEEHFVLAGRYQIERGGDLAFDVQSPKVKAPFQKLRLTGVWTLDEEHNLVLKLDQSHTDVFGETLVFHGQILDTRDQTLRFALGHRRTPRGHEKNILEFQGQWEASAQNHLVFRMKRTQGRDDDLLTLQGLWELGRSHELSYRYQRKHPLSASFRHHQFKLKGAWSFGPGQLKYRLEKSEEASVIFHGSFSKSLIQAVDGQIRFLVTIALSKTEQTVTREIIFRGEWDVSETVGVSFQLKMRDDAFAHILFKAIWRVDQTKAVVVTLQNTLGEPLDLSVRFSRKFANDRQFFLDADKHGDDLRIFVGGAVTF